MRCAIVTAATVRALAAAGCVAAASIAFVEASDAGAADPGAVDLGAAAAGSANAASATGGNVVAEPQRRKLPSGFVYLTDVDPTVEQDMRYATADNFTGAVVNGYKAGECILTRSTAEALSRAQKALATRHPGHSLKVYDCYRPVRAVSRFAAWSRAAGGASAKGYHHPAIPRSRLFALGYIALQSGHSRGNVVDLTIVKVDAAAQPKPGEAAAPAATALPAENIAQDRSGDATRTQGAKDAAPLRRGASCTSPMPDGAASRELDMGTDFDCFDARSNTHNAGIGAEAMRARRMLLEAMGSAGFSNFSKEWWHYSYARGAASEAQDFVVAPRAVTPEPRKHAPR